MTCLPARASHLRLLPYLIRIFMVLGSCTFYLARSLPSFWWFNPYLPCLPSWCPPPCLPSPAHTASLPVLPSTLLCALPCSCRSCLCSFCYYLLPYPACLALVFGLPTFPACIAHCACLPLAFLWFVPCACVCLPSPPAHGLPGFTALPFLHPCLLPLA